MKGAVLHRLNGDVVKERLLRRHYGTKFHDDFKEGEHPESRKIIDVDGKPYCEDVMFWYAKKVQVPKAQLLTCKGQKIKTDETIKYPFVFDIEEAEILKTSRPLKLYLFVSTMDEAPKYYERSGK
jgi:hypothetical protein